MNASLRASRSLRDFDSSFILPWRFYARCNVEFYSGAMDLAKREPIANNTPLDLRDGLLDPGTRLKPRLRRLLNSFLYRRLDAPLPAVPRPSLSPRNTVTSRSPLT